MSNYRDEWRSALADVQEAGALVVFTPDTGAVLSAYAIQAKDDPRLYEAMGLVESHVVTLFVVPITYGALPSLVGRSVTWAGETFLVKKVPSQIAPDGTCIAAYVVVAR